MPRPREAIRPWWSALVALLLIYYYAHYAFASITAHVTAMLPVMLAVGQGIPGIERLVAVGVAACIGIFFGFYPAWRASRLNPIECLRYE